MTQNKRVTFFRFFGRDISNFDPNTRQWQPAPNKNQFQFWEHFRTCELPDGSYLITGGKGQQGVLGTTVHYFQGSEIVRANMGVPRMIHSVVYHKGYVYVIGGHDYYGQPLNSCECFDMNSNAWLPLEPMKTPRALASACKFNDSQFYVFGGVSGQYTLDTIERFDLTYGNWTILSVRLTTPVYSSSVSQAGETNIIIMGGYNPQKGGNQACVSMFDVDKLALFDIKPLDTPAWSVMPLYHMNGSFFMFTTGEEKQGFPQPIPYAFKGY